MLSSIKKYAFNSHHTYAPFLSSISKLKSPVNSLIYPISHRSISAYAVEYPQTGDFKYTFEPGTFKVYKCEMPEPSTYISKEDLIAAYIDMFTVRRLELLCDQYYKNKQIWGFCHLCDGQEAVCVGIESALKPGDHIITAYREHGWAYTRGDSIAAIFAEMFGKSTGCARGKGGSMHLYYPANNFYGGNGIVGAQVPIGTGIALAAKQKGDNTCVVTAYGDGAANQGQVFESFNMAALWKLPVIYLCENNRYAMGTSIERAAACYDFYTRGDYIPGIAVDGMDYLAMREAGRFTSWYARNVGPIVLEALTYRYHGHSMSDPGISYRAPEEVQEIRSSFDPLRRVRNWIVDSGYMSEEEIKKTEKDIRKGVEVDAASVLDDVELTQDQLALDIYSTGVPDFVRYSEYGDSLIEGKYLVSDVEKAERNEKK